MKISSILAVVIAAALGYGPERDDHQARDQRVLAVATFRAPTVCRQALPAATLIMNVKMVQARDVGRMDLEMTFDDAKYYTRPFGFKTTMTLLPDDHMLEYVCTENQKFRDAVAK